MLTVLRKLCGFLGAGAQPEARQPQLEDLQREFRTVYHNFLLLLTANGRAMAAITAMEEALQRHDLFGMSFVRAQTTAALVNVFRMVRHLEAVCPPGFPNLHLRFKAISADVQAVLDQRRPLGDMPPVRELGETGAEHADQVGVRMANLGRIKGELALPTPEGFVLTARAYELFMAHNDLQAEINRLLQAAGETDGSRDVGKQLMALVRRAEMPPGLKAAMAEAYARLEARTVPGVRVALRSSALGEDFAETFFSGLSRFELDVGKDELEDAYRRILAGKYESDAMGERLSRGIPDEDVAVCVGVTAMVEAACGGVATSRNPADMGDATVRVLAGFGLPGAVVDGGVEPDHVEVRYPHAPQVVARRLGAKELVCGADRCRLQDGDVRFAVDDDQAVEIARLAWRLDAAFGGPVELVWAIDHSGRLWIIQCRPLRPERVMGCPLPQPPAEPAALLCGGVAVSRGAACGPVHLVRQDDDLHSAPAGAVLVGEAAMAHWAPAMDRAAALLSEFGNPFGHLANVARDRRIPAIYRLEGACALRQGELVTVDADGLRVYPGRMESVLAQARAWADSQVRTPVQDILGRVLRRIAPLNLVDADAPNFRPSGCETLHDIACFCHERAVQAMFSFGQDKAFARHMARQLFTDRALQWWVINLDGAFTDNGQDGKFIRLEHIDSLPMQAVWAGICAFPWEGSPPVNAKGLLSVMFESTVNPDLLTTSGETFSTRNYFMVSRDYVTVSSRFGYHYTMIEALVGERPPENSIRFRFKGGAAEAQRRRLRLKFVGEILDAYGFRVEIAEEELTARLEGREREFMETKLRILGYLIIHTRQLDMIMKVPDMVHYHREKINRQIGEMLAQGSQTCRQVSA